ncbi:MAG: serine hydrolase [bacterium]
MKIRCFLLFLFFVVKLNYAQTYQSIDKLVDISIKNKITPSVNVIIGNSKNIVYQKAYGTYTYDDNSTTVDENSLYDLASLTKVFATTMCIMKLVDDNKINIEDVVVKYLPKFASSGKDDIKLKNLLLHNSGLPSYYTPLKNQSPSSIIDSIFTLKKAYSTGSQMVYSCLNFVTLMKVVEAVTGKQMYEFYNENILTPLKMSNSYFVPTAEIKNKCVPTTPQLQGDVHDPLAFGLKGLSGNAGLFSNTHDLAIICQMMLNNGVYENTRIFKEETVKLFTHQWDSSSSRALGWDTNTFFNTSAGPLFSASTFGHTGYTGTSVWIDPVRKYFVVLLTNRVYPDDHAVVSDLRIKLHNLAIMELENIPPQPKLDFLGFTDNKLAVFFNVNNQFINVDKSDLFYKTKDNYIFCDSLKLSSNNYIFNNLEINDTELIEVKLLNNINKNISTFSDIYGCRGKNAELLIIDACTAESTPQRPLNLTAMEFYNNLPHNLCFESCSIDFLIENNLELNKYKYLIIYSSEEAYLTFFKNQDFINKISEYVKNGGNLFFSGSEFGWYLGRNESGEELNQVFGNLFSAKFKKDNSAEEKIIGDSTSIFNGLNFTIGNKDAIYTIDSPDEIIPINNSVSALLYKNNNCAGLYYSNNKGKVVYFSFPFETIVESSVKKDIMNRIFDFFNN